MLQNKKLTLAGAALLLTLSACSGSGDEDAGAEERRTVSVAVVVEGLPFLPFYVGLSEGIFDDAGIDVDVTVSNSGPAVLQAVTSSSVDFGSGQADSVAVSASQNAPASLGIGALFEGIPESLVFRSGWLEANGVAPEEFPDLPPAEQLALLEGARVATYGPGGLIDNVFSELADVGGVDADSMTRITIPGAQPQIVGMGSDQVDAAVLGAWPILPDSGDNFPVAGSLLADLSPLLGAMPHEIMFVGQAFLDDNEDTVRDFMAAMSVACNVARETPALELAESLQSAGYLEGSPPEELAIGIEDRQPAVPEDCLFSDEALEAAEEFSVKHGAVPESQDWGPLYTNEFIQ